MKTSEEVKFPLIFKRKTVTYKIITGILIGLAAIAFIEALERNKYATDLLLITFFYFLASQFFLDIRSLRIKEYQVIGTAVLDQASIRIQTETINVEKNYSDVQSIKLEINETSRDPNFGKSFIGMGLFNKKRDGVNNILTINTKENEEFNYRFFVEDIETIKLIDRFSKNLSFKLTLMRNGKHIHSILDKHCESYPPEFINTRKE